MRASEFVTEAQAVKQRLDPKCWKGKHKEGTKIKGGVRVNNCVPNESVELDEIDRRGFLKGLGAAAVGAAGGYKLGQGSIPEEKKKYFNPKLWFLCGYLWTDYITDKYKNFEAIEDISEVNGILRNTPQWDEYVKVNQQGRVKLWEDLDKVREALGLPPFKQVPLQQNEEKFRPWLEKRMAKVHEEIKQLLGMNESKELEEEFDLIENIIESLAERNQVDAEAIWEDLESLTDDELYVFATTTPVMESQGVAEGSEDKIYDHGYRDGSAGKPMNDKGYDGNAWGSYRAGYLDGKEARKPGVAEDWQKANKKDKTDGMSQKAVNAYRREHPGSKLKTAVTTKPSKLKKGSKASKRRKSYCSRSKGQMKMHNISCAKTPDKAICKARRRWNC